tara:strand:+ start:1312 stop:2490 length:1179 start_codon:yes stop_codon:yes gene_type:complete
MSHLTPPNSFCCSTPDGTVQITASSISCSFWTFEIQSPQGSVFFSDSSIYANGATASIGTLPVGVYIVVVTDTCDGNCSSQEFFAIGSACANCGCTDPNAINFDYSAVYEDGTCLYPGGNCGCNDPNASNYNAAALCDDGSCLYDVVEPPCIPTYIDDLIVKTQLCAAKRGYTLLNKIRIGQEDQCSVLNAWKIILMEYLLSKVGNNCIYNCADDDTAVLGSLQTCLDLWKKGGWFTGNNHNSLVSGFQHAYNTHGGTDILDPIQFFGSGGPDLRPGDWIRMPSGNIYRLNSNAPTPCSSGCHNPETMQGAMSGYWSHCDDSMRSITFDNNINYLDNFSTFVNKFCSDCDIRLISNSYTTDSNARGNLNVGYSKKPPLESDFQTGGNDIIEF